MPSVALISSCLGGSQAGGVGCCYFSFMLRQMMD